eukprot:CAMPEP_0172536360 /NCGR_PEP_ID=MMETSP1067-20121228/8134_1 /TAXON_ID=265564 ORGANISM="Thalassiosira punctigera, Strain Tpunct2005C2" /NCGR_SAMPLE_ID=MMETSP1067 /ASSEMBLY_ACC=CAM_ASM_000444 /LENGTH=157 /DNA_ID=CAMNT_0013321417 /DNA_START=128 /DNA_END=601 /DNA_ORIENTATION=+
MRVLSLAAVVVLFAAAPAESVERKRTEARHQSSGGPRRLEAERYDPYLGFAPQRELEGESMPTKVAAVAASMSMDVLEGAVASMSMSATTATTAPSNGTDATVEAAVGPAAAGPAAVDPPTNDAEPPADEAEPMSGATAIAGAGATVVASAACLFLL